MPRHDPIVKFDWPMSFSAHFINRWCRHDFQQWDFFCRGQMMSIQRIGFVAVFFVVFGLLTNQPAMSQPPASRKTDFESLQSLVDWYDSQPEGTYGHGRLTRNKQGKIESIRLVNIHGTDQNLKLLSEIPTLNYLRIHCSNKITESGYVSISQMTALDRLDVGLVYQTLPANFWRLLSKLPKLDRLDLIYLTLPADELNGIEAMPALEQLRLTNIHGLSSVTCSQLTAVKNLRWLEISGTSLRPSDISALDGLHEDVRVKIEFK